VGRIDLLCQEGVHFVLDLRRRPIPDGAVAFSRFGVAEVQLPAEFSNSDCNAIPKGATGFPHLPDCPYTDTKYHHGPDRT
jgi:hypothetical protein